MKKLLFVALTLFFATACFAQTQKGYVKTKGRLDNDGNLIPGTPLSEVVVKVKDRNEVMSDKRGDFSFPMPDQTYYLESVVKNGYVLIDPDVLSKQYSYSKNKLVIALETKEDQMEERMDNFAKINAAQNEMIRKLRAEVKQLKEENKITEEEYSKRLQEIADVQIESQQLVEEMVERYSKIDYDQLSEFDRQISVYILNGELHKADSLLNTKGDLNERAENLKKLNEANAKEREEITKRSKKLEKSEALALKERDNLASDYYHKFEILKMQHKNDSAAYYLELRAALDTTNVEWIKEAGDFIKDYVADYIKSKNYYQKASQQIKIKYGESSLVFATIQDDLGRLYQQIAVHDTALYYLEKALSIRKNYFPNNTDIAYSYANLGFFYGYLGEATNSIDYLNQALDVLETTDSEAALKATIYNNLSQIYNNQSNYDKAIEEAQRSLTIFIQYIGNNHPTTALVYNNIGSIYLAKKDYVKAAEYFEKAIVIQEEVLGFSHPELAQVYNNYGLSQARQGDYDKALLYYNKALTIFKNLFGDNHSRVAIFYNNIGMICYYKGDYQMSREYLEKSLNITKKILGEDNVQLAILYSNLGMICAQNSSYDDAIEYLEKALLLEESYTPNNSNVAQYKYNLAHVYCDKGDYDTALEMMNSALVIYKNILGDNNLNVIGSLNDIGYIYKQMGDFDKSIKYFNEALGACRSVLGEEHPQTQQIKESISEVQAKLKESKKK